MITLLGSLKINAFIHINQSAIPVDVVLMSTMVVLFRALQTKNAGKGPNTKMKTDLT